VTHAFRDSSRKVDRQSVLIAPWGVQLLKVAQLNAQCASKEACLPQLPKLHAHLAREVSLSMSLDPRSAKLAMQGDFPMLRTPQFALCAMSELLQTKVE